MLSTKLQKKLDQLVPKKDQKAFIESAIDERLTEIQPADQKAMIEVFIDGGSRGNPGIAGGGFVAYQKGEVLFEGSEFYGEKTNNQSEYLALRTALREVFEKLPNALVKCYMDSQLVVEQMNGNFKVKSENVRPLFSEVRRIADQFKSFQIEHIRREDNARADALANQAMDQR